MSMNSLKMKRCKSTGSVIINKSSSTDGQPCQKVSGTSSSNGVGVPWRAAARAQRSRASNSAYRKNTGEFVNEEDEFEEEDLEYNNEENEDNNEENLHNLLKSMDINKINPIASNPASNSTKN